MDMTTPQLFLMIYQTAVLKDQEITPKEAITMMYMAAQIDDDRLCHAAASKDYTVGRCVREAFSVHRKIVKNDDGPRYAWMDLRYKDDPWVFVADGEYEKEIYEITAEDYEIVRCWPNAGLWNSLEKDDERTWKVGTVKARLTAEHPMVDEADRPKRYNREMTPEDGGADGRMFLCAYCSVLTPDDGLHSCRPALMSFCIKAWRTNRATRQRAQLAG